MMGGNPRAFNSVQLPTGAIEVDKAEKVEVRDAPEALAQTRKTHRTPAPA